MVDALRDAAGDSRFGTKRSVGDGRHREVERLEEGRDAVELVLDDLLVRFALQSHRRHAEEVVRQRTHVFPVHLASVGGRCVASAEFAEDLLARLDEDGL